MTVLSRLFPAASGPGAPTAYAGPLLEAVTVKLLAPKVQWLQGFYAWVPAGGDVTAQTFALWALAGAGTGALIPGTSVTSGPLTAGQWNYVPIPAPVPLSAGTPYVIQRGWTSVSGFPVTNSQFGTGGPYVSGLTSGSVFAYSDGTAGGTAADAAPYGMAQGLFSTATANASAAMAATGSNSANFWTDALFSDTAPPGYSGTYELNPHNIVGNSSVTLDLNVNYNVGTVFTLAAPCPVLGIKMLSPPGASGLPTAASVWSVNGLGRTKVASIPAPAWSGAAGSGQVTALFPVAPVLPAGTYVAAVYNSAGTLPGGWNAKDSQTGGFGPGGDFAAGISNGPLSAPNVAGSALCYDYSGSATGANPPYSAGTTEAGQCVFGQMPDGSEGPPYLYAGPPSSSLPQLYFVGPVIGQPVPAAAQPGLPMLGGVL